MAHDYSKKEVLDIVEKEARERGIPRDDFLRFAYIETGGGFDENAAHRNKRGEVTAAGLFQFVPDTARAYGIRGKEFDPVANTDAAARLYLHNREILVTRHERDDRPYLSGKPQPDGLDMYLAHQQGAGGYRSIQMAIQTGHFSDPDTRKNFRSNISADDCEKILGVTKKEFMALPDREIATKFVQYWDTKYDRIAIPEKNIQPLRNDGVHPAEPPRTQTPQQPAPQQPAPAQPSPAQPASASGGIVLEQAHQLGVRYNHVKYGFGEKNVASGEVDCSGWVSHVENATMREINAKAGRTVFDAKEMFSPGFDHAAGIVEKAEKRSGVMIEGKAVTADVLKEGMIIGEDNGKKGWDAGRHRGIDHITMVVRDPATGELKISQSRGGEGVEMISVEKYLAGKHASGAKLYATDPLAEARDLLKDHSRNQTQDGQHKPEASKPEASKPEPAKPAAVAAMADGVLERNEKGSDVRALQTALNKLGYTDAKGNPLGVDGDFGKHTEEAVRKFQEAHKLKVDGEAGPDTLGALKKAQSQPLLSDPKHPQNGMYEDALKQLDKLGGFKSPEDMRRTAATLTYEARVSGLDKIEHVVPNLSGTGYFAVKGEPSDPGAQRAYSDKNAAASLPVERVSEQLRQDVPQPAQTTQPSQDNEQQQKSKTAVA
ncbi:XVIPCD domain-containing protein [Lysobacter sp. CA199]|uniref:XVIPCD domain-containing protein n=1 Tax=Lysobacter sp. CA199 TaxID=3455608 RepID=UPI003F8D7963